jgi:hypothetical protein
MIIWDLKGEVLAKVGEFLFFFILLICQAVFRIQIRESVPLNYGLDPDPDPAILLF